MNIAVFPEFCLSGYFWDAREDCLDYMREAVAEHHAELDRARAAAAARRRPRGDRAQQPDRGRAARTASSTARSSSAATPTTSPTSTPTTRSSCRGSRRTTPTAAATTASCSSTRHGRLGFTTCYDYLFSELLREYAMVEEVDAIVQIASWRAAGQPRLPGHEPAHRPLLRRPVGLRDAGVLGDQPGLDDRLQRRRRATA